MAEYKEKFLKSFTLAEILIVLMVIGVLATMTIPSLLRGVQGMHFRASYSKAANTIINLTAAEKVSGNLPAKTSVDGADSLFDSLSDNLPVIGYLPAKDLNLGTGTPLNIVKIDTERPTGRGRYRNWILTDGKFSYLVTQAAIDSKKDCCSSKLEIINNQTDNTASAEAPRANNGTTNDALSNRSCYVIYVDVNSVTSGPNTTFSNSLAKKTKINSIVDDTYPIYVGIDGATSGNPNTTITGRITSAMK